MTDPFISVLLPIYNGEKYLREAIDSILAQTYSHFELILIDDGSTDATPAIIAEYAPRDSRIRVQTHSKNSGRIAALNTGLGVARGEYIARMDQDDVSLPERFAKQVAHLEAHPETGILGTAATVMDKSGAPQGLMESPLRHELICWALCFYNPMIHPTIMARRDVMQSIGGYRVNYPMAEDYDLWTHLSQSTRIENLPEPLLLLRKHGENDTVMHKPSHLKDSGNISRDLIRTLTNLNLTYTPLELAWEPRRIPTSDLMQTVSAITRLMDRFLPALPPADGKYLRRETALQLARLTRNTKTRRAALDIFFVAFKCDPFSVGDMLRLAIRKALKK
jgi:glycosyltransferase involved in cell wall biosynthesis